MSLRPHTLSRDELMIGLRAAAVGDLATEAATELLIRHGHWIADARTVDRLVVVHDELGEDLALDWDAAEQLHDELALYPEDRAVLAIAASLVGRRSIDLGLVLSQLRRPTVHLVLAAVSHATGTHLQVEHVGELSTAGEWVATSTSPRVQLGPLFAWPEDTSDR